MILVNGKELTIEKFPNNEVCIRNFDDHILGSHRFEVITLSYESDQDLMNLFFVKKHIDETFNTKVILNIAYMPYSRMDRTEGMNVFTLKHVSKFINDLNFSEVNIIEPHSDVTSALVDRSVLINKSVGLFKKYLRTGIIDEDCYLVFPDSSADKRYSKIGWEKTLTCIKHRDFETGRIKSLEVIGERPKSGSKAVIIDDLCSKGGTFMLTAQKLSDMGIKNITLVVAHCEDSIHEGEILKSNLISRVITTNSILKNSDHPKIICDDIIKGKFQ